MKTLDTLTAYRNTCTVSYWRDGWRSISLSTGLPVEVETIDHDISLPFGQVHPLGSGSGGRVRMGDEMRPTEYRIMCQDCDYDALKAAHDEYIKRLLG